MPLYNFLLSNVHTFLQLHKDLKDKRVFSHFGKKVYLDRILNWLNYYNTNKINKVEFKKKNILDNQDSFFLNNNKLSKEIKLKFNLKTLEIDCKKISKKIFHEK